MGQAAIDREIREIKRIHVNRISDSQLAQRELTEAIKYEFPDLSCASAGDIVDAFMHQLNYDDLVQVAYHAHLELQSLPSGPQAALKVVEDLLFATLPFAYFRNEPTNESILEMCREVDGKRRGLTGDLPSPTPIQIKNFVGSYLAILTARLDSCPMLLNLQKDGTIRALGALHLAAGDIKGHSKVIEILKHFYDICRVTFPEGENIAGAGELLEQQDDLSFERRFILPLRTPMMWLTTDPRNRERMTPFMAIPTDENVEDAGEESAANGIHQILEKLTPLRSLWRYIRVFYGPSNAYAIDPIDFRIRRMLERKQGQS